MSKVQVLLGMPARRTADAWRYLDSLGYVVDPSNGEVEHPDTTRIRRENLRRFNLHSLHHVEDMAHESGFPGPGGNAA